MGYPETGLAPHPWAASSFLAAAGSPQRTFRVELFSCDSARSTPYKVHKERAAEVVALASNVRTSYFPYEMLLPPF
ncbi:hypothetical protein SPI_03712 [Niveomyces insectorum RCEF 264]|uniref:Uncharacterized protein n=1 Tax=Niveomyces insectorum RCEF 264 TaxID=1081102 RepID=A0A167WAQ2_9HYPO|nr:hypothetical protein SPI_03712 [Niveomyces insectorum RCEF 264]